LSGKTVYNTVIFTIWASTNPQKSICTGFNLPVRFYAPSYAKFWNSPDWPMH